MLEQPLRYNKRRRRGGAYWMGSLFKSYGSPYEKRIRFAKKRKDCWWYSRHEKICLLHQQSVRHWLHRSSESNVGKFVLCTQRLKLWMLFEQKHVQITNEGPAANGSNRLFSWYFSSVGLLDKRGWPEWIAVTSKLPEDTSRCILWIA